MKILILELARLGDIYQSWPAIRGLKRIHPDSEVHILTRERYAKALEGLEGISKIIHLPSKEWVEPVIADSFDVKKSHELIGGFISEMKEQGYDWIVNFTFSPLSSYLVHAISHQNTKVSGYTRTSDGFLAIPDDISAYFYAQVGPGKPNRFHLAEIFATMVGVDLSVEDWRAPSFCKKISSVPEVLVHIGASENRKSISPIKWTTIINQFQKRSSLKIGLIGAPGETAISDQILSSVPEGSVTSFVGKTNLTELFSVIASGKLLIGADSSPMHIASLTGTPCLNLSLDSVNFWETGPRAPKSVVLKGKDETEFASDMVAEKMLAMIKGERVAPPAIFVQEGAPSYWHLEPRDADFQWKLVKAIYQSESLPISSSNLFKQAVIQLDDINRLMLEQLAALQGGALLSKVAPILDRGEEIIETIGKLAPDISPLVRWYATEKVRIGPNTQDGLIIQSLQIHQLLQNVLDIYLEYYHGDGARENVTVASSDIKSEGSKT